MKDSKTPQATHEPLPQQNLLPKAPIYFPIERGVYEVGPGLKPLGFDFGNGKLDQVAFQIDENFSVFRENKIEARKENLQKYHGIRNLNASTQAAVVEFLLESFTREYPDFFLREITPNGDTRLHCALTDETLLISKDGELLEAKSALVPMYQNAFDALISQVQEDAAIVSREVSREVSRDSERDWLSMLHVTSPSHWDPQQKLGLSFIDVHSPIPGSERLVKAHKTLVDAMISKGPFVRFVWSFVTDTRLNHHPLPPDDADPVTWKGRSFDDSDPSKSPFHLRIERQLTLGLPETEAALFLIRVHFVDGQTIRAHEKWRTQLISALQSMSPESRIYKGVAHCFDSLIHWLGND